MELGEAIRIEVLQGQCNEAAESHSLLLCLRASTTVIMPSSPRKESPNAAVSPSPSDSMSRWAVFTAALSIPDEEGTVRFLMGDEGDM